MRKSLLLAAALVTAAPSTAVLAHPKPQSAETKPMSSPKDDHSFAMHMAQHHRDGIAMADAELARGSSDDVKAIARRIKSDQQKDLAALDAKMKGHKMSASMPKDPDMERAMAQLKAAKGADADRLFLELMMAHHASAMVMTQSAMDKLSDGEMKTMARDMFAKQARDIGEMQRLRESTASASR